MMEQLYSDFTEKVLPKVAEGFIMTKDYFTDLSTRYVKYFIVTDSIWLGLWLIVLASAILVIVKLVRHGNRVESEAGAAYGISIIIGIVCIVPIIATLDKAEDLIKDLYIPEVRIYEQLSPIINRQ